jgi:hypothetical protein
MLASNGEITGPCPVPLSLAVTAPCSSTPTLSHFLNQADDALVADPMLDEADEPIMVHRVEERADIGVQNEVHFPAADSYHERLWFAPIAMTERHRPVFTLVQSRLIMRWVAGSRAVTT